MYIYNITIYIVTNIMLSPIDYSLQKLQISTKKKLLE